MKTELRWYRGDGGSEYRLQTRGGGGWEDVPKVDECELSFITAQVKDRLTATELNQRREDYSKAMNDRCVSADAKMLADITLGFYQKILDRLVGLG